MKGIRNGILKDLAEPGVGMFYRTSVNELWVTWSGDMRALWRHEYEGIHHQLIKKLMYGLQNKAITDCLVQYRPESILWPVSH